MCVVTPPTINFNGTSLLYYNKLIILLQYHWKKAKEANAKEPTKNPKEAHD